MIRLFHKLLFVQVCCVLATVGLLGFVLHHVVRNTSKADFLLHGRTLASSLANATERGLVNRDLLLVQSALDASLKIPNAEWAFVVAPNGRLLAQTFVHEFPRELASRVLRLPESVEIQIRDPIRTVVSFGIPVLDGSVGHVYLGINENSLENNIAETQRWLAVCLTVVLLVTTLFFSLVARKITGPVTALTHSALSLANDPKAPIALIDTHSQDEMGQLTQAFAQMASQIQGQQSMLERSVQDRTLELQQALDLANEAKQRLATSEEYTRAIVESSLDAIITFTIDGRVTGWNHRAESLWGFTAAEAVGRQFSDLFLFEDAEGPFTVPKGCPMPYAQASRRRRPREAVARGRDAAKVDVELVITPFQYQGTRCLCAFVRDISERRKADADLFHAYQTAQEASQAKSEFLATMSHEIRTPMNGVLGFVHLLMDTPLDADQRELANTLSASANALLTIINDILDFSKIEAGCLELESAPFDPMQTAGEAAELLSAAAEQKNVGLALELRGLLPPAVLGDSCRFRQVVLNLLGNAVKFTERGNVRVSIQWNPPPQADQPGLLNCAVSDSGIGIAPENLERLFQKFTQADSSMARRFGGTGLGLAISKRLVELMGGTMNVISQVGKGSTFSFSVPLQPASDAFGSRMEAEIQSLAGSERVLVVVQNDLDRSVLCGILGTWGIDSTAAQSRSEAMEAIRTGAHSGYPYSIVIADLAQDSTLSVEEFFASFSHWAVPERQAEGIVLRAARDRAEKRLPESLKSTVCLVRPVVRPRLLLKALLAAVGRSPRSTRGVEARPAFGLVEESEIVTLESRSVQPTDDSVPVKVRKVLLVDDNSINQFLGIRFLKRLGCEPDVASSGREAIALVQKNCYDLILMDCQMPDIDGFAATQEIRQGERRSVSGRTRVPIIALTANVMPGDRERCLVAGMDDYLSKPMQLEALQALFIKWCSSSVRSY